MMEDIKVGDRVVRWLGGAIPMPLRVTQVTGTTVECSLWTFDRATGAEIDDDLGWGPPPRITVSFIVMEEV
jgi:hypothetical protein